MVTGVLLFTKLLSSSASAAAIPIPCGGGGCTTGKGRSIRVRKQAVVVGFPDGTEAEVPLDQVTWEGRDHIKPA